MSLFEKKCPLRDLHVSRKAVQRLNQICIIRAAPLSWIRRDTRGLDWIVKHIIITTRVTNQAEKFHMLANSDIFGTSRGIIFFAFKM